MIRCLIIDDDKFERDGLRYMISQMGLALEVCDVRNGRLGLESMEKGHFDIVITDIKMPVMDGIVFLERAKERHPDVVYIIYSGHSDFEYAKKAISLQVLEFLVKPVTEEEFERVMNRAMDFVRQRKQQAASDMLEYLRERRTFKAFPGIDGQLLLLWGGKSLRENFSKLEEEMTLLILNEQHYLGYRSAEKSRKELFWRDYGVHGGIMAEISGDWENVVRIYERMETARKDGIFRRGVVIEESICRNHSLWKPAEENLWEEQLLSHLKDCSFLWKDGIHLTAMAMEEQEFLTEQIRKVTFMEELEELIGSYRKREQDMVVYEIKHYIGEHYQEEITVDMLAKAVYLTPSYLCTIFKKNTGTTLVHYLTQYRIEQAMELLKNGKLKTAEIAKRVGYHNISYFNLVFKARTGKTPGQYRKEQEH